MTDLTGKTAIVTGSARGIGKAIALRYASLGANVVVNYVSDPAVAEATVADVRKFGVGALAVRADVSALADIERIFSEALARFSSIDIVVVSAAVEKVGIPLIDVTEAQFDQLYAINTKGAFFTLQAAARHVVDGGRIIYLGSTTSELPVMGVALYGSSKIGPRYVAQVLAQELAHRGVAVNAILPTAIQGAGVFTNYNPDDPLRKMVAGANRIGGRMGTVDDVADAAEYFASDLAAWVSGQTLVISGGEQQQLEHHQHMRMRTTMSGNQFNASSTAAEVLEGVDLAGRRAVVTGASSGIGTETARALAAAGADVTMAVRNVDAGNRVAEELRAGLGAGAGRLQVMHLDLADLSTVRAFASAWSGPLHIMVNNAGVMAPPTLTRSPQGWETQFATNHMGHFALARQLHGALAAANGARVVSVASIGHLFCPVVFDDLHYRFRPYDPWTSYGQSKCANVLFAVGAAMRWAQDGITANALMPGNVGETALVRHIPSDVLAAIASGKAGFALPAPKTIPQGAATSVLLAASPLLEGVSGRYFEDCAEAAVVPDRANRTGGVAAYALDQDNAMRLWRVSEELLKLAN